MKGFRGNFEVLSTHMIFNLWKKKNKLFELLFISPYRGESFWNDALRERQLNFKRKKSFRTKMRQFVVFVKFVVWINDMDTRERDESEGGLSDD